MHPLASVCLMCAAQVLREHRETLVSVMETFLHDPLCEWTKRHRSSEEADNPQAKDALATLEGGPDTRTKRPPCRSSWTEDVRVTKVGPVQPSGTDAPAILKSDTQNSAANAACDVTMLAWACRFGR